MPKARIQYSPETKAKIIEAVIRARKTGSWKDAHAAAQGVGYTGSVDSLVKMMAYEKKAAKKAASAKKAAPADPKPAPKKQKPKASPKPKAKPAAAKKRGRPAKIAAPAVPALDPVAANYLAGAIDKAIGELQKLRQQYAG